MKFWVIGLLIGILSADFGGGYAGASFRYASNAREKSLGGAMVAEQNAGYQQFSNPALLPLVKQNQLGLSYFSMSLDRSIQTFSFTKPLPPKASVAISFFRSGTTNIRGTNSLNEFTENYSVSEMFGMLSFGVSFSKRVSLGLNVRMILNELTEEYNTKSIAMDFGVRVSINDRLQLGVFNQNLFGFYQWKIDVNNDGDASDYIEELPKTWLIGSRYMWNNNFKVLSQIDLIAPPNQDMTTRLRGGVEYLYNDKFAFRMGIKQKYDSKFSDETLVFNFEPSFGIGLPITVWKNYIINFDYSFDYGSENEGMSHLFTWTMEL